MNRKLNVANVRASLRPLSRSLVFAAALALMGTLLGVTAPAFAESATSPSGMLGASVPPPVVAGLAANYTITVTNITSSPMSGIVLSSNMPTGMTVKNINGCVRLGGNQTASVLCTLPNLAPAASETATLSLLASTIGTFDVPFNVSGGIPVPSSPGAFQVISDAVTLSVSVQAGPTDLQITGSSNNGSPPVGSAFSYSFQVKNNGPLPAFGVTFDDSLPTAIQLGTSLTIDNGSCTSSSATSTVHCDIGALGVGQQADITFSAVATAAGTFANTATTAMIGSDVHPANNTVTVTIQAK